MIPKELKERKQWICWKYETIPGRAKPTKIPYNPITGFKAKSSDASTWTDFETAKANMGRFSGIGFVFTKDDPYVGIDLDAVLDKDGKFIQKDAQEIFDKAKSYTEISPSGTGIHIIGKARLRDGKPRKVEENPELGTCEKEVYEFGRYFTVTGHQMGNCNEVNDVQELTNMLEDRMLSERVSKNGKSAKTEEKKTGNVVSKETVPSQAQEISASNLTQEETQKISPGLMKFTRMIYPDAPNQVRMATKVGQWLSELQITRVVKSGDIFIDYTRKGDKFQTVLKDEGKGFHIPEDPLAQKAYLYGRLIRNLERNHQLDHEVPSLEDMHEATRVIVDKVRKECLQKGHGTALERVRIDLHELGTELGKKPTDLWNEIRADMAMVPEMNKTVLIMTGLQENKNNNCLMISKEINTLFRQGEGRNLENSNEQSVSDKGKPETEVSAKFFRPVVRDMYLSNTTKAMFTWLENQGVKCRAMTGSEMDEKQIVNCSLDGLDFRGMACKGMTVSECTVDDVKTDEKTDLGKVEFEKCRFASDETFKRLVGAKAVIKNCMVRQEEEIDGKKVMRWNLQNAEEGKVRNGSSVQCLSMPGAKGKPVGRNGFER